MDLTERLKAHLQAIAIPRDAFADYQNLIRVQEYIEAQFRAYGYQVERQSFQTEGRSFENLVAFLPQHAGSPEFIVAAHFDAVPGTPGADDNASGVAVMLETARLFAQQPLPLRVHFIAFNLEEYGMLGSGYYAQKLKSSFVMPAKAGIQDFKLMDPCFRRDDKAVFHGMISLEMVGYTSTEKGSQQMPAILKPFYPSTGDFLALVGDEHSGELLKIAKKAYHDDDFKAEALTVPMRGNLFPEVRLSDHSPFWDEGFPALLVTDTSFFRNPNYHQVSDTIDTLDLRFMEQVVKGTSRLLEIIAERKAHRA